MIHINALVKCYGQKKVVGAHLLSLLYTFIAEFGESKADKTVDVLQTLLAHVRALFGAKNSRRKSAYLYPAFSHGKQKFPVHIRANEASQEQELAATLEAQPHNLREHPCSARRRSSNSIVCPRDQRAQRQDRRGTRGRRTVLLAVLRAGTWKHRRPHHRLFGGGVERRQRRAFVRSRPLDGRRSWN